MTDLTRNLLIPKVELMHEGSTMQGASQGLGKILFDRPFTPELATLRRTLTYYAASRWLSCHKMTIHVEFHGKLNVILVEADSSVTLPKSNRTKAKMAS